MLVHIDTDMGVDDGLALVAASHLQGVVVHAVSTVFGNVPVEIATRNALLFRSLLGADWPVFEGAAGPPDGRALSAGHIHGDDGLGGATACGEIEAAVEAMSRLRAVALSDMKPAPDGRVILLAIGPATNVPALIQRYGRASVDRVVLMTGVFFDRGNISDTAEFNAACDPAALREVVAVGLPTTLVPLDVCRKVQLARRTVQDYAARDPSPLMQLVAGSHMAYMDHYRDCEAIDGCLPHDTVALLAAVYPDRFFSLKGQVSVDMGDGTTRFDEDPGSNVEVVTGGDLAWIRRFLERLEVPA